MRSYKGRSQAGSRSFISNQDLLEGMRNKSSNTSQARLQTLKSQPSQVALIPQKSSFRSGNGK